jgi:CheY-like chemotaxis protein
VRAVLESRPATQAALKAGTLTAADANQILAKITMGGTLRLDRFAALVRSLIGPAGGPIRLYGEVVSLLAGRGDLDAAIAVEELGHQLAASARADVLCAYDLRNLDVPRGEVERVAVCHHRSIAAPAGSPPGPVILVADDFEDGRELYRQYLEFNGYRVVTAVDGVDAVEQARRAAPVLLLLDIQMPRMSGVEAMQILKRDPAFARVPAVALTAHALDADCDAFLAQGFDTVVTKPCLPEDLVRTVDGLLAGLSQPAP